MIQSNNGALWILYTLLLLSSCSLNKEDTDKESTSNEMKENLRVKNDSMVDLIEIEPSDTSSAFASIEGCWRMTKRDVTIRKPDTLVDTKILLFIENHNFVLKKADTILYMDTFVVNDENKSWSEFIFPGSEKYFFRYNKKYNYIILYTHGVDGIVERFARIKCEESRS